MDLKLKQGYYKDINRCEEIMKGSKLYETYFDKKDGVKEYIRMYFPDNGNGQLYFAETPNGELAGLMLVSHKGFIREYDYLALLGVKENYRGQGIGSFLLQAFEKICRDHKCKKASLMVSDFNSAFTFYKKHGFYRCGVVPNNLKEGVHEYILLKDLD